MLVLYAKLNLLPEGHFKDQVAALVTHLEQRAGDGSWLLDLLFLVSSEGEYPHMVSSHAFFKKDYRKQHKTIKQEMMEVDDSDNFLEGLPINNRSKKGKVRNGLLRPRNNAPVLH